MLIDRWLKIKQLSSQRWFQIILSTGTTLSFLCTGCLSNLAVLQKEGSIEAPLELNITREPKFSILGSASQGELPALVIYNSDQGTSYIWLTLKPIGVEWPSDKRATVVANRLEQYRLEKMTTLAWGKLNGEKVICAYTERNPYNCQTILTVPSDVNVDWVLYLLRCKMEKSDSPKCSAPIKT